MTGLVFGEQVKSTIEVTLSDYSVLYKIANAAFSMTATTDTPRVVEVCRELYKSTSKSITRKQIQKRTGWKAGVTHKRIRSALSSGLLKLKTSGANNEKRYLPAEDAQEDFLPAPKSLLKKHPEFKVIKYTSPLSGRPKTLGHRRTHGTAK